MTGLVPCTFSDSLSLSLLVCRPLLPATTALGIKAKAKIQPDKAPKHPGHWAAVERHRPPLSSRTNPRPDPTHSPHRLPVRPASRVRRNSPASPDEPNCRETRAISTRVYSSSSRARLRASPLVSVSATFPSFKCQSLSSGKPGCWDRFEGYSRQAWLFPKACS